MNPSYSIILRAQGLCQGILAGIEKTEEISRKGLVHTIGEVIALLKEAEEIMKEDGWII